MAENKSASFEASLGRLAEIVAELEREGVELERAVGLYREGKTLIARCEKLLADAEATLRDVAAQAAPSAATDLDERLDDEVQL